MTRRPGEKLRKGQIKIWEARYTKADYAALEPTERQRYFSTAQLLNEIIMLRLITSQALAGPEGPRPVAETSLALAFFGARLLAGRITEAYNFISGGNFHRDHVAMLEKLRSDDPFKAKTHEHWNARQRLDTYFAQPNPLIRRIRNKLAAHLDPPAIAAAFELLPDDVEMHDFHSGLRGSTFFGGADTLAAVAASHLAGTTEPYSGMHQAISDASDLARDVIVVLESYLYCFIATRLGTRQLAEAKQVTISTASGAAARLRFYVDERRLDRESSRTR